MICFSYFHPKTLFPNLGVAHNDPFLCKLGLIKQFLRGFTSFISGLPGLEKLGFLEHESPCSSKQVKENIVHPKILCTLQLLEVQMFSSLCTSSLTKWNILWKDEVVEQNFAISSRKDWKVIQEKEPQALLHLVNYI